MDSKEDQSEANGNSRKNSGGEWRNWAELPRDVLVTIFQKIAAAAILSSAQFVCRPWRDVSYVPELWRCIDMRMYRPYRRLDGIVSMAMIAVNRSAGCVEELFLEEFMTDELMYCIADRATRLLRLHLISVSMIDETRRRLQLISPRMNDETLAHALGKLTLLEELQISHCDCFSFKLVKRIGEACPQLKSFRLDDSVSTFQFYSGNDAHKNVTALAIADHFKQLRRLQLFANCLTSFGLSAILDNGPDLQYLDIRHCFNVGFLDESLKSKTVRLKVLRLPNDSIADYEYRVDVFSESNIHLSDTEPDSGCSYDGGISFDRYKFSDFSSYHDDFM